MSFQAHRSCRPPLEAPPLPPPLPSCGDSVAAKGRAVQRPPCKGGSQAKQLARWSERCQ